ncbi:MAG: tRNA (5-methylaminomethyl-2-thiouridine)(34)-methyltransferase MnmD [Parafilimonas sp.]
MNRKIIITGDGSHSISINGSEIIYHSKHGAIQESKHVFINAGLTFFLSGNKFEEKASLNILEIGFGTGLNALLSLQQAILLEQKIFYHAIEPHPLNKEEFESLNYPQLIDTSLSKYFLQMHQSACEETISIHPLFSLVKSNSSLQNINLTKKFHLIYFDAFHPNYQPELWTTEIFKKMYNILYYNGMLVTYSSKGNVCRSMLAAGFSTEKIAGPPHKREMLRAIKKESNIKA